MLNLTVSNSTNFWRASFFLSFFFLVELGYISIGCGAAGLGAGRFLLFGSCLKMDKKISDRVQEDELIPGCPWQIDTSYNR